MKTGAKTPQKIEFLDEPQTDLPINSSPSISCDPLAAYATKEEILFIAFAAGVISAPSDSLQSTNIEMWPSESLYKLRSNLISMSLKNDEAEKQIQKDLQDGFDSVLNELRQNEDDEPLRFVHLPDTFSESPPNLHLNQYSSSISSYHQSPSANTFLGRSTSTLYLQPHSSFLSSVPSSSNKIRFDQASLTRPTSPSPNISQGFRTASPRIDQSRSRPASSSSNHLRRTQSTSIMRSAMTPETIWENVSHFIKPIDKMSTVMSYLSPSKPKYNANDILAEPLGPHYSTTICQSEKYLSDPSKSSLIIPPPMIDISSSSSNANTHSRLISAFVPLLVDEETGEVAISTINQENDSESSGEIAKDQKNNDFHSLENHHEDDSYSKQYLESDEVNYTVDNEIRESDFNLTPTADSTGITRYGLLNFEERLAMELEYVGIKGSEKKQPDADGQILHELAEALKEQEIARNEANKWRKIMLETLQKRKSEIDDRDKKHKQWNSIMNNFLAQEKAKFQQEKKKSRPHTISTESD